MKKTIISVLLYLAIVLGSGTIANAATIYAQGGIWNYGVGSKYVWLYYSNNYKAHGSTAVGKYKSYSGKREQVSKLEHLPQNHSS
ncbi:lactococcin 972 family bacteriocin [Staphylococcus equorum]|uniref:lactococcin 972 family bacteriocin n=1 Tax=Staphylococcus equorum TaxID=246432 RepID=UPI00384B6888